MVILELGIEELRQGVLAGAFARGAVAGIIHCEGHIHRLWSQLLENRDERLPWESTLTDIARNHHGSDGIAHNLGDVYYFQPGYHCYIARKFEIVRARPNDQAKAWPSSFVQGDKHFALDPAALSDCCCLVDRIMSAMTPTGREPEKHKATVQRLKYQDDVASSHRLAKTVEDSLGRWGRFGFALDRYRGRAVGILSVKGISDLLAVLMLIPFVSRLAGGINAIVARFDRRRRVKAGEWIIEGPHYDGRYFTGLCGTRDTIRTEAWVHGSWLELPVGLDSIIIFPGKEARRRFKLRPTLHRVVHVRDPDISVDPRDARTRNVTLLIGAAPLD